MPTYIRSLTALAALTALTAVAGAPLAAQSLADTYRPAAQRIIERAQADSSAWNTLAELTDRFGPRLSGSDNLEHAIDWILAQMKQEGFDAVRGEPVMVPHWVRGNESLELVAPRRANLPMLGLGMSVGTPPEGITADVVVVSSFDELEARSGDVRGKIVLFDAPFTGYGETVAYRTQGASRAAQHGAVAALVRSVASASMASPHTGTMTYDSAVARIPTAAVTVEDAMMLHRMQQRGTPVRVTLKMEAKTLPDVPSRNVVAEIRGTERPDEVVVLGGHIDSWDVGQGAMDDGGGCVAAWEALRLIRELGLQPRRTIRVVFWTNEENGTRGGTGYLEAHRDDVDQHILALESDNGAFRPRGFGFTGSDEALAIITEIGSLLAPIGADSVSKGGGGADIGPLMRQGVPGMSPRVDGERYFWYHHSHADTMDKLDPAHMQQLAAAMAVMVYTVADLPQALPR
jgi:carboxypeptidase Q